MPAQLQSPAVLAPPSPIAFTVAKVHARRLREVYRSAGWPCQDPLEIELLAAGLLARVQASTGHEHVRVTDAGLQAIAASLVKNRAAFSAHEALVERIAREMARAGRVAWRGLSLRAQVPGVDSLQWCIAKPDVFSIRNTSVPTYVDPVVHEVKVRRADLLSDLKNPLKRAAYMHLGACWYVLGTDAKGRYIAEPDEVPAECGVILAGVDDLVVARPAPIPAREGLPFGVWMALAKATCLPVEDDVQVKLGEVDPGSSPG